MSTESEERAYRQARAATIIVHEMLAGRCSGKFSSVITRDDGAFTEYTVRLYDTDGYHGGVVSIELLSENREGDSARGFSNCEYMYEWAEECAELAARDSAYAALAALAQTVKAAAKGQV